MTDEITKAWSNLSVKEYKKLKDLKKESLRDNMTNLELVLNMLAEVTTKEISKKENPSDFSQSAIIARRGGNVAGNARKEIETETGESVITDENYRTKEERLLRKERKKKKLLEVLNKHATQ